MTLEATVLKNNLMIASWQSKNVFKTVENNNFKQKEVSSNNIAFIGYDKAAEALEMEFLTCTIYE